jgi:6-pyruvoyltetrahydropterin/6-carboxytetrahydropterin synthase
MSHQITATMHFSASHRLRLYDGSLEPLHGHNWKITVTVGSQKLDEIGVVMDFHDLARRLRDVIHPMHNHHLNDLAAFAEVNPTAENVAQWVAKTLPLPESINLVSVEVWETTDFSALYRP